MKRSAGRDDPRIRDRDRRARAAAHRARGVDLAALARRARRFAGREAREHLAIDRAGDRELGGRAFVGGHRVAGVARGLAQRALAVGGAGGGADASARTSGKRGGAGAPDIRGMIAESRGKRGRRPIARSSSSTRSTKFARGRRVLFTSAPKRMPMPDLPGR